MAPKSLKPLRTEFANRLRQYRVPRGYRTARMFALALGIDENRYTRYERAEVEPDLALLVRICTTLEITPNDLLGFPEISKAAAPTGCVENGAAIGAQPALVGGPAECVMRNRRAIAWQIACKLAAQPHDGEASTEPLALLARTSGLFREIEADPFEFVASAAENPVLREMPPERQSEVVASMNALLACVEGGPSPSPVSPTPRPRASRAPRRQSPS